MKVEITLITVSLRRFVRGLGMDCFDSYTVAVLDPEPTIGKFKKDRCNVEWRRAMVNKNSVFHKEAVSNSAAGKINWKQAGLAETKGIEWNWNVNWLVKIRKQY